MNIITLDFETYYANDFSLTKLTTEVMRSGNSLVQFLIKSSSIFYTISENYSSVISVTCMLIHTQKQQLTVSGLSDAKSRCGFVESARGLSGSLAGASLCCVMIGENMIAKF